MSKSSFSSFPVDNRRKLDRFAIHINAFYNKFQYIHTSSLKSPFTTININNRLCISNSIDEPLPFIHSRTTDAQGGISLHCTAKNSIPIPNFWVRPKHILSATSAQFFRYLRFMPSMGVRSPCLP